MFEIAGGILLALFIILMFLGFGLLARGTGRFIKRNPAICVAGVVIGIVITLATHTYQYVAAKTVAEAGPTGRVYDFSKVPHTLFPNPAGGPERGYYQGNTFVCSEQCQ